MQRKPTIGLLTSFLGGNYLGEMMNSIQRAALQNKTRLVAIRTAGKKFDCPIALDYVDGWIILNNAATDSYIQQLSNEWSKPIVGVAKDLGVLNVNGQTVICDNEGGIMAAVRHLHEHGHRSIGFVGHLSLDDMKYRLNGYKKGLEACGLRFDPHFVIDPDDLSVDGGRRAAEQIAQAGFPFRAVVVCTDMMAIGMIKRFEELGVRIPEDMAIIGFDNTIAARSQRSGLSSIDQNIAHKGQIAVELLLRQINNPAGSIPSSVHRIECTLIARGTCGCSTHLERETTTKQILEDHRDDKKRVTQLGVHYEFNKFILNYNIKQLKNLSWALAPHFQWGCLGKWNFDASPGEHVSLSELYHFQRDEQRLHAGSMPVESFPPLKLIESIQKEEDSEMIYIIPYRTEPDNWSVLAAGTRLSDTVENMDDYMSVVHYLDLIGNTLDKQALLDEVREQGMQYRQIAEQLEIVSRTTNDGIWEWDLVTGEVAWNQRFYDLLQRADARTLDYFVHSEDEAYYKLALRAHINEHIPFSVDVRLRKHSGEYVWTAISGEALYDSSGTAIRMVGSVRDITERKQSEEKMRFLAYHDTLTGLMNRRRFFEEVSLAAAHPDQPFALIVLDLDHFKKMNDSFGHQMGDRLLQLVADGLRELVREGNHIARFGGDEFVVLHRFRHIDEIESFICAFATYLSALIFDEGVNLTISASAGISLFPRDGTDADSLFKKADIAMYHVKQSGKNHFEIFSEQMIEQRMWRLNLENELKQAVLGDEFVLHYQPQIDMETGQLYGFEALLRWNSPTLGCISPMTFIPLAEETGLIVPIGEWVLREACSQNAKWLAAGHRPLKLSVNISGRQLKQADFIESVKSIVNETRMDPNYLCFEITESTVIDDLDYTISLLRELESIGIQIAMDDFGTGYSSLSMIRKLPLNSLKIDKSFIQELSCDRQDIDIVKAIISISNSLNLRIVAEGVEQAEQYKLLQELGCHYMQGFYISQPLPADQLESFLYSRT
ncbi:EAL domain-containing protein [Paenibacillus sp. YIM B09110]|uniref:EAL domain-containing protein n=1 Tax=Paenibacillus sp. YIM B09110 TaxID=3126102 RepID=UPI00301DBE5F